jgi:phage FluMu gp28-like protein
MKSFEQWKDEMVLAEYLEPCTFLERLTMITNPVVEQLESWKIDPYQRKVIRDDSRFKLINKSRKTGISTILSGWAFHTVLTEKNVDVAIVSTAERIAWEIMDKIKSIAGTLPPQLSPTYEINRNEKFMMPNKSRILSLPASAPTIRGLGLKGKTYVLFDEFASAVAKDPELWDVAKGFMVLGGGMIINSTPLGKIGKFYEIASPLQAYHRGIRNDLPKNNIWSYHEIPWWYCPRLKEETIRENTDDISFRREYTCDFVDEGISFFPFDLIYPKATIKTVLDSYNPTADSIILMGVDFAKKEDETAIVIFEKKGKKCKQLFATTLAGTPYNEQERIIIGLEKAFNPTYIKVDQTGPGESMYDNLAAKLSPSKVWGYVLTSEIKEKMMVNLRIMFERNLIEILSEDLPIGAKQLNQLHAIERTSTETGIHARYSGKETGKDDLAVALAIALYEENKTDEEPFISWQSDTVRAQIADATTSTITILEEETFYGGAVL